MTLLETLRLYQKETDVITTLENNLRKLTKNAGLLKRLFISLLVLPTLSQVAIAVINFFVQSNQFVSATIKLGYLISFIHFIWWTIRVKNDGKKREILQENLNDCLSRMKLIDGGIPEIYQKKHAIDSFIHYIETIQATTLKECINLYNEERRHKERMDAMADIRDHLDDIDDRLHSQNDEIKRLS